MFKKGKKSDETVNLPTAASIISGGGIYTLDTTLMTSPPEENKSEDDRRHYPSDGLDIELLQDRIINLDQRIINLESGYSDLEKENLGKKEFLKGFLAGGTIIIALIVSIWVSMEGNISDLGEEQKNINALLTGEDGIIATKLKIKALENSIKIENKIDALSQNDPAPVSISAPAAPSQSPTP